MTKKKSKTFKAEITKGTSDDIERLEEKLDITHSEFLKWSAELWHGYEHLIERSLAPVEKFGIYLDKKIGLYKAVDKRDATPAEKIQGKIFMFGLWMSEMNDEQKKQYIELLKKGLTAEQIFQVMWSEQ